MADNKLARWASAGIERQAPEVKSLARPTVIPLLAARTVVQTDPGIQGVFKRARAEGWTADALAQAIAPLLGSRLECTTEECQQAAQYLADEYMQIGGSLLMVSRTTGKAIAQISEADIWQPAAVPRDSGSMAKPLPRLRPDLEGYLVQMVFDEDRESKLLAKLAEKLPQTELVRVEGDKRLQAATRAGRQGMTATLRDALPTLLQGCQGAAGMFLRHLTVTTEPPTNPKLRPLFKCTAMSRVSTPISDPSTFNPRYDRQGVLGAQVGNGWVRDIALTLALGAKDHAGTRRVVDWPSEGEALLASVGADLWIGSPDFTQAVVKSGCNALWLAVEGANPTAILGHVGTLVVDPAAYECRDRELFSRWEVAAAMEYTLYMDWSQVASFEISNLPVSEPPVEVLR